MWQQDAEQNDIQRWNCHRPGMMIQPARLKFHISDNVCTTMRVYMLVEYVLCTTPRYRFSEYRSLLVYSQIFCYLARCLTIRTTWTWRLLQQVMISQLLGDCGGTHFLFPVATIFDHTHTLKQWWHIQISRNFHISLVSFISQMVFKRWHVWNKRIDT